jgi:hypothetical protein
MANDRWFTKKPCAHCPFRRDVRPFLRPERGEDLAYSAENPYNDFPCHKTTVEDEDSDEGDMLVVESTLTCAGFLSMQIEWGGRSCPKGFKPSDLVYSEPSEMADAYREEWERDR